MKTSAILKVFNAIAQDEIRGATKAECKLAGKCAAKYDELKQRLDDEQLGLLAEYDDAHSNLFMESENNIYIDGFRLGLLLGIECMEEE